MIKVKKFDNIWTMGLILFGAILVFFYIAKLFFPEWIIGVAETPRIVEIGEYIDGHIWCFHLFNIVVGFIGGYIYCCACLRTYKLSTKALLLFTFEVVLIWLCSLLMPQYYTIVNYLFFIISPITLCLIENKLNKYTLFSTFICFFVDVIATMVSLKIRDLFVYLNNVNSATMMILIIDTWIWRILLYLYFNEKRKGD